MTDLSNLNPQQREAVLQSIDHNLVLMAGAGAGKTATLIKRTQYLLDDLNVSPENIMMITFTNKAANEILERMKSVSDCAYKMWIGTFHKICTRLIRMFGHKLNVNNFTIMDPKEAKELVKEILNKKGVEYTPFMVNDIIKKISEYKNNLIKPSAVLANPEERKIYADTYQEYQNISWRRKCFDFDDLIIYAILLLSSYQDVADWVHQNIKYIMLDEMQDTNAAQFTLAKLIAGNNNIMMVGDTCQSIYGFRNAKPQYLEDFANSHPNTVKLKLEQNYRSTKTIIQAANHVVNKNKFGTKLTMFCDNNEGEKIQLSEAATPHEEARWIAGTIIMEGGNPSDYAVIYRANFQSRILEEEFMRMGLAYTIFGSQSFYSRKEIRDLIAYCKAVINEYDVNAFKRVLGTLQGVGSKTIDRIIENATTKCISFHDAIDDYIPISSRLSVTAKYNLSTISNILNTAYTKCSDIVNDVLYSTDYTKDLRASGSEEATERLAIIQEFIEMLNSMEAASPNETMANIIDQVALLSDAKGAEKEQMNAVKLMTAHASKGLEFKNVFIIGAEEGIFPHANAINIGTDEAIEEERRLFYVAMTRAKEKLYISRALQKVTGRDGSVEILTKSRFLKEIPSNLTEEAF